MAGPYTATAKFSNGQVLKVYLAANQAVGTYPGVEINGAATATSQPFFKFKESVTLVDLYTDETAGQFEIVADDDPSGKFWCLDASIAPTNNGRITIPLLFRANVTYKLLTRIAGAA